MEKSLIKILLLMGFIYFSCQKSKVIELNLPPQTPSLSVECYLQSGKLPRLLLTETSDYYQPGYPVDIKDAFVTITHNGKTDTMKYQLYIDTISNQSGKVYNYYLPDTIHAVIGELYSLYIKDSKGRIATAQTSFLNVTPIDSLYYTINSDNKASLKIEFTDDKSTVDQYRILLLEDTIAGGVFNDVLIKDYAFETTTIGFNTTYKFEINDSLIVDLYHVSDEYYTFLKSVSDAGNANGNPFAVPAKVNGNVSGGIGIFQALAVDRRRIAIIK